MKRPLAAATWLLSIAWPLGAAGSATFPAQVDQTLSLTKTVEQIVPSPSGNSSGNGCLLCHTTEAGGFNTNNAFGTMMKNSGAQGGYPRTVGPAILNLEQADPRAIADLVNGINPNNDPAALSSDPVPQYGCSASARGPGEWPESGEFMAIVSFISLALRRRARKS